MQEKYFFKHLNFHTESDLVHCDVASVICIHESVLLFSSAKNSSGHQPPGYYWSLLLIGREDNGAEAESRARSQEHADYHCKLFAGGGSTMTNVRTCCRVVQLNDDKCGDKFLYLGGVTTAEPSRRVTS